ncbi:MAG: hypothetical protein WC003_03415 [Terrimicrobiaceae bacterium]
MGWTETRRETVLAAMASVLLHLVLILCVALALSVPAWQFPVSPSEKEAPIEVMMMPVEAPSPHDPLYVRTTEENTPEASKNAPFESDKNTRAASETAPVGSAPVPSLDGRESPDMELANRNHTKQGEAAVPQQQAPEQTAPPEPQATPVSAPPDAPSQLALREAPARPKTEAQAMPAPTAQPKPPAASGFQPETRITRIRGGISNRGKASVDAAATPLGRYKKMVSDAIGSRWYYYVNDQIGLLNIGTVEIRFIVSSNGKVGGVKVLANTSNESFASVSVNSIIEAEIPPIPDEVAKLLVNGRLEIDYTFTILSN